MVHVSYHSFLLSDVGVFGPSLPLADANGLVVAEPGIAVIITGIHTGNVGVRAEIHSEAPPLDLEPWEEVVEVSLEATTEGRVIVTGLGADGPETLPALSPQGRGHYRIRVHANGRDTAVDMTTSEPVEHYLIQSWPAPPTAEVAHKHSDRYGADRRQRAQSEQ